MEKRAGVRLVSERDVPSEVWEKIEQGCRANKNIEFDNSWWCVRDISRIPAANGHGIVPTAKLVEVSGP
jgi:hypothetical protein